jgi:small-conductance mechanosensitive channel
MDIGDSFQRTTDKFFDFLPNLLGFLIILLVGYIIAKLVSKAVSKLLEKAGVDRRLHESDASRYVDRVLPGASASKGIALVVFWLIFVFFLFSAIGALKIPALTSFMNDVLAYLPNVIVAILIFVVAALLASAVAAAVSRVMGDTPTGKIVATVVPALVMVIALFMILEQLQIAPEIVRIAFAAVMFALALGLALAFGLGGRSVAERLLEEGYRKGQDAREQMKADMSRGRDRAGSYTPGGAHADVSGTATSTSVYDTGSAGAGGYGTTGDGQPRAY